MRSLGWNTQKFTSGRLWMRSVFGYERISIDENPRMIVHYVITCKYLHHGCLWKKYLYYLSNVCLNILFKTKMTYIFFKFRIVDMLSIWLNKKNDNFDWFKFVWLGFLLVCNVNVILYFDIWVCFIDLEFLTHLGVKHPIEQCGNVHPFIF